MLCGVVWYGRVECSKMGFSRVRSSTVWCGVECDVWGAVLWYGVAGVVGCGVLRCGELFWRSMAVPCSSLEHHNLKTH